MNTIPGAWGQWPEPKAQQTWKALLTQIGTNVPTAKVLINTLNITPVWTRNMAGNYTLTVAANTFKPDKTEVWGANGQYGNGICIATGWIHDDSINIVVSQQSYGPDDGYLVDTPFTITVYNS